jgi:hypothetical protein
VIDDVSPLETAIVKGTDGFGLASFGDLSARIRTRLKVAHCNDTQCTGAAVTTLDSGGDVGRFSSIMIGADGLGLISYYDQDNGDLKVAHCDNPLCTSASLATLDSEGDVGIDTSITKGPLGLGLISYVSSAGDLKVAFCSNLACSSAAIGTVPNAVFARSTSIAMNSDGMPVISYVDIGARALRVVRCRDLLCEGDFGSIATVEAGDVAGKTSLKIGSDGLPLISYGGDSDLRVAHCGNLGCTTATTATLDAAGHLGDSSIAIGADGLGIIAYHDTTTTAIKMAHCVNRTCLP